MKDLSSNLFLLIANLAQQDHREKMIRLYIEGLNTFYPDAEFAWHDDVDPKGKLVVSTRKKSFGEIRITRGKIEDRKDYALIQNSAQMLALLLDRLEKTRFLNDEKKLLQSLVDEKTKDLAQSKKKLESRNRKLQKEKRITQEQKEELVELNEEYESLNDVLRKTNEDLYDAKERAEESNQLKTEFLHNLSHEIRTPINSIMGFTGLLLKKGLSMEKMVNYTKIIRNSSVQLMRVIDDILEISALETKKVKLNETESNLDDLLLEMYSVFEDQAKAKNLELRLNRSESEQPLRMMVDMGKLRTILGNLIENALKYTYEGFVELGIRSGTDSTELYIKDTGIGIPKKNRETIFERFTRGGGLEGREAGGLGLGLAIVSENASLIGADLELESEVGKGTEFRLKLRQSPRKEPATKSAADTGQKPITILIAEDDENSMLLLETLISHAYPGSVILRARNGEEALTIARKNQQINLVFMDIKMPVKDGLTATREIKAMNELLPVVIQSAYVHQDDRKAAREAGCNLFVGKPIEEEQLREIISVYVD